MTVWLVTLFSALVSCPVHFTIQVFEQIIDLFVAPSLSIYLFHIL